MDATLLTAIAAVGAALTGWGMWWNGRQERQDKKAGMRSDERTEMFDDALQLAKAQKEAKLEAIAAYKEMCEAMKALTAEADTLRDTVQGLMIDVDRWRGVAVAGVKAEVERTGSVPLWWPPEEPLP